MFCSFLKIMLGLYSANASQLFYLRIPKVCQVVFFALFGKVGYLKSVVVGKLYIIYLQFEKSAWLFVGSVKANKRVGA